MGLAHLQLHTILDSASVRSAHIRDFAYGYSPLHNQSTLLIIKIILSYSNRILLNLIIKSLTILIKLIIIALLTLRDPVVILTNYINYTLWLKQLKTRCQFLKVWSIINPALTDELKQKPAMLMPLAIGNY